MNKTVTTQMIWFW